MAFDAFLATAWADHGDRPEEVARRLDDGAALIDAPAQIAPFARLAAHVDGEHLAHWEAGAARLERLRAHAQWRADGDGELVVSRLAAALRLGAGGALPAAFGGADRAHAQAFVAAAWLAQGRRDEALAAFAAARAAAAAGLPDGDPALRALAVAANNVAAALEEAPARSADETAAMLAAARTSREAWARAGGWLETERAEYLLAQCLLAAGDAAAARDRAQACVALCAANVADDFERFFAQAALALAHRGCGDATAAATAREAALAHHAALGTDLKPWCESTLRRLD